MVADWARVCLSIDVRRRGRFSSLSRSLLVAKSADMANGERVTPTRTGVERFRRNAMMVLWF